MSDISDDEMLTHFLRGRLPHRLLADLEVFIDVVKSPLAIRSSSLLEDSHYQPFAGIYSTYMIPYSEDKYWRLEMLSNAIKYVYYPKYEEPLCLNPNTDWRALSIQEAKSWKISKALWMLFLSC